MKRLGYVQKLDKSAMPNVVKNIEPARREPRLRPEPRVLGAVAVGQVLLIYRKDKTGGDLTSINDLFDPKFKGKVTMLTEMRDTVGSVLLGDGHRAREGDASTRSMQAIDKIEKATKDGQIRRFTGNDYTQRPRQGRLDGDPGLVGRRGRSWRPTTRTSSYGSPRRAS